MKYAIVDNEKVEASKGIKGVCPICQQLVIPKCGQFKIDHWAHKSVAHCDKWWENETEWHRNWKNLFPKEWQEVVAFDEITGEKHIADIKTNMGLIVEFQHSHISDEERVSREKFYKTMIWIVDGTRRKNDYNRFIKAIDNKDILHFKDNNRLWFYGPGNYLPKEWLFSKVPVIFDFKGLLDIQNDYDINRREHLWCLFPREKGLKFILEIPRDTFIDNILNGREFLNYK